MTKSKLQELFMLDKNTWNHLTVGKNWIIDI